MGANESKEEIHKKVTEKLKNLEVKKKEINDEIENLNTLIANELKKNDIQETIQLHKNLSGKEGKTVNDTKLLIYASNVLHNLNNYATKRKELRKELADINIEIDEAKTLIKNISPPARQGALPARYREDTEATNIFPEHKEREESQNYGTSGSGKCYKAGIRGDEPVHAWFNDIMEKIAKLENMLKTTNDKATYMKIEKKLTNIKNLIPEESIALNLNKIYNGNIAMKALKEDIKKYIDELEFIGDEYSPEYVTKFFDIETELKGKWNSLYKIYPLINADNRRFFDSLYLYHTAKMLAMRNIIHINKIKHEQELLLNKKVKKNSKEYKDLEGKKNKYLFDVKDIEKFFGYEFNPNNFNTSLEESKILFGKGKNKIIGRGFMNSVNEFLLKYMMKPLGKLYIKRFTNKK